MQPGLLNSPQSFATSLTGQPGDSSNIQRLTQLNSANLLAGGTQTLQQYFASTVGNLGAQVQNLTQQQSAQQAVNQQLQTQQQGVSGVQYQPTIDPDGAVSAVVSNGGTVYLPTVTAAFTYLLEYL